MPPILARTAGVAFRSIPQTTLFAPAPWGIRARHVKEVSCFDALGLSFISMHTHARLLQPFHAWISRAKLKIWNRPYFHQSGMTMRLVQVNRIFYGIRMHNDFGAALCKFKYYFQVKIILPIEWIASNWIIASGHSLQRCAECRITRENLALISSRGALRRMVSSMSRSTVTCQDQRFCFSFVRFVRCLPWGMCIR